MTDLWANPNTYPQHVARRVAKGHITGEAYYFTQVKHTLMTATRVNLVGGKYPSAELVGGDWSVILNYDGLVKTAYRHEKNGEAFTNIQSRLGHTIYENDIGDGLGGQLKQLFG